MGDLTPFVDDRVGGFGDDPRAGAHRPRRRRADAGEHAVAVAGHQPDLAGRDPSHSLITWANSVRVDGIDQPLRALRIVRQTRRGVTGTPPTSGRAR
jgi:hypothetical protein